MTMGSPMATTDPNAEQHDKHGGGDTDALAGAGCHGDHGEIGVPPQRDREPGMVGRLGGADHRLDGPGGQQVQDALSNCTTA